MRPKTLAVLALLVGGLAAFVAFYEKKLPSTDERRSREKKAFVLTADDVVRLELDRDGTKVRLERDPKPQSAEGSAPAFPPPREWRLVEPMTAKADRTTADRLASDLASLDIQRRLEGVERKEVGLDAPRGTIRWATPDAEGTLEIGGEVPASSNVVVAASGRPELLVVGKSIVDHLNRAPGDWRAKEVVAATRDEIERIRLVPAGGGEVVLSRKGDAFVLERPIADAADRDLVDPLLSDLTALRAERFLDAPLAPETESGLAASAGRIELSVKGANDPISIELGAETDAASSGAAVDPGASPERYLRVAGQAIVAKTKLAEAVAREPEAWRSKAWTGFESWKVERIRVEDATGKLELTRDGGDWLRDGVKIPYTEVGDLLYAVTGARAESVLAAGAAEAVGASSPEITVVFADANGAEETMTLNGEVEGGVAARVSGRDVVLVLPAKSAEELRAKLASVRAAKPAEEPKVGPVGTGDGSEESVSEGDAEEAPAIEAPAGSAEGAGSGPGSEDFPEA